MNTQQQEQEQQYPINQGPMNNQQAVQSQTSMQNQQSAQNQSSMQSPQATSAQTMQTSRLSQHLSNQLDVQRSQQAMQQQQPKLPPNPGLSEREIEEILMTSGVINGTVTNGVKLGAAIADILVKNNQLLMQAVLTGNIQNAKPYEDPAYGPHQTAQPTEMWPAGPYPQAGMPAPDTQTNHNTLH